jgi:hypothetical protein
MIHYQKKLILYQFGSDYISEVISLPGNIYNLMEFLVVNENDEVIYASPTAGSSVANLIQFGLPLYFTTLNNETLNLNLEVVPVEDNNTPGDFGYNTFSFNVVEVFTLSVAAFAYQDSAQQFELTSAYIEIVADSVQLTYSENLEPETNHFVLRDDTPYTITVSKGGYETFVQTFDEGELKAFTNGNPLTIEFVNED